MSFEIPLFPLNTVLFPGMPLPLHIFEPRYRLMIRRCLEADRTFGVALILEGQEGLPGTVPAATGCSAEITNATPFPDGRLNLQTIGRRRFQVLTTRLEDDYLIGTVEWLDDAPSEAVATEKAVLVSRSARRYLKTLAHDTELTNIVVDEIEVPDDPYELSMWAAALLPFPVAQKQELLRMSSTAERLQREYDLLRRGEIIQRAFSLRMEGLHAQPQGDEAGAAADPFAQYVSPN